MIRRIPIFAYDWTLVAAVLAVNALGLITLKSAAPSPDLMLTQLVGLAVGIGGAVVLLGQGSCSTLARGSDGRGVQEGAFQGEQGGSEPSESK